MALPSVWTSPATEEQAVGANIPAARLNKILGNLLRLGGTTGLSPAGLIPAVQVSRSGTQSLNNNTSTVLSWNSEAFDTDAMYDAGTPTRITCKTAGIYLVSARVVWAANTTGERTLTLNLNAAEVASTSMLATVGAARQTVSRLLNMAVNDYLEAWGLQNSGGALFTVAASAFLEAVRVA